MILKYLFILFILFWYIIYVQLCKICKKFIIWAYIFHIIYITFVFFTLFCYNLLNSRGGIMNLLGTVTIETPRLILRRFFLDDAEQMFYNWANDDEVTRYLTWPTHKNVQVSKEITKLWVEQYKSPLFYQWAMELKETHTVIGTISIINVNEISKTGELGYCLSKSYWNQGLMSEASHYVFDYAFNTVHFNAILSKHHIDNPASGKVMLKNKMTYFETKSEFFNKENKIANMKYYIIRKEDFNAPSIVEC